MSEVPRHWRLQKDRYRLIGQTRQNGKGPEFSLDGIHWTPSPNGHKEDEGLMGTKVIYQAEKLPSLTPSN